MTREPGNTGKPDVLMTCEPGNTGTPSILNTWEPRKTGTVSPYISGKKSMYGLYCHIEKLLALCEAGLCRLGSLGQAHF